MMWKKIIFCFLYIPIHAQDHQLSYSSIIEKIKDNKKTIVIACSIYTILSVPVFYYFFKKNILSSNATLNNIHATRSISSIPTSLTFDLGSLNLDTSDYISVKTSGSTSSFPPAEFRLRYSSLTQKSALKVAMLLRHISALSPKEQDIVTDQFLKTLNGGASEEGIQT